MSGFSVTVAIQDRITPLLKQLPADLSPARAARPAGQAVQQMCVGHFTALAAARHHGYAPQNFYADAARATLRSDSLTTNNIGATLTIRKQGLAQRYFGGHLEARNGGALAIPANTETYGHSPLEYGSLKLILFNGPKAFGAFVKQGAVSQDIALKRRVKGVSTGYKPVASNLGQIVMFWLVREVDQAPDESVLPTDAALQTAAYTGVRSYVTAILDQRRAA